MEPIVSPWFIYALSFSEGLKEVSLGLSILGVASSVVWIFVYVAEGTKKSPRMLCVLTTIFTLMAIATPSRNTLLGMYVASQATPDNIRELVLAGKDFKDAVKGDVIDIIREVQGDKDKK